MLKDFARASKPDKAEIKMRTDEEQARLATNQIRIKEAKVPVMVIFEGWGSAGKGSVLSRVIKDMDPRFFQVSTLDAEPTEDARRYPFLWRYMVEIPEEGQFKFYDTFWMEEVTHSRVTGDLDDDTYDQRIDSINMCERQLVFSLARSASRRRRCSFCPMWKKNFITR